MTLENRARHARAVTGCQQRLDDLGVDGNRECREELVAGGIDEIGQRTFTARERNERCGRSPAQAEAVATSGEWRCSSSQRCASSAAIVPEPAAVTAWRYVWSWTSPAANTPGMFV